MPRITPILALAVMFGVWGIIGGTLVLVYLFPWFMGTLLIVLTTGAWVLSRRHPKR